MPVLFVFLLKVNVALLVFCAGYYFVLRHLTFYTLNRVYLISAIVFASIYPKINLSGFAERHQHLARPVSTVIFSLQAPAKALVQPLAKPNYWHWAEVVFWAGAFLLTIRLLMQLYSLYKLYRNSTAANIYNHDVRVINDDTGPFSFWKSIYVNPARHEPADLKSILLHEQVHVSEWHTLDILLAELSTIFYWFNPGVWLMKKAVRENIEFITDHKILQHGVDTKQYQYSLVNVSFSAAPQGIVNHFNISTIKKRIIMMNAKRSSKFNLTRYIFLVPVVIALLLVFSISKAAFAKKGSHTLHQLALKIKTMGLKSALVVKPFIPQSFDLNTLNTQKSTKPKVTDTNNTVTISGVNIADTTKKGKFQTIAISYIPADTIKKNISFSVDSAGNVLAKPMYIVDGVIVKDYEIGKVDPGNIESIRIGKGNNGTGVVYIKTKNGVDGMPVNRIRINGVNVTPRQGKIIDGRIATIDTIRVDGVVKVFNGKIVTDTTYLGQAVTIRGFSSNKYNVKSGSYNFKPATANVYTSNWNNANDSRFSLTQLSDKLIIINGNIATVADLKKLSAFDIDRMTLKTDEETKELYGDKAKNGIVFIITKKKR